VLSHLNLMPSSRASAAVDRLSAQVGAIASVDDQRLGDAETGGSSRGVDKPCRRRRR